MSRRRYQQTVTELVNWDGTTSLPTDRDIAVYYRQSTHAQVGNVSTSMQVIDMPNYLMSRGWKEENIILIDTDEGVSGTKKIDERSGMKELFSLITEGRIGAVACQDEDRLFRDITQIQVNIFIEACRTNRVLVIVPSMVYDFSHPQMGTFHMRQFRFKSEMAAEHIVSYIKGRLHPAKKRLMLEGRWAGGTAPLGFMIDERKFLSDGRANPNWRRYTPYEPHAEIVREYFRLFVSFSGNLRATARHIAHNGPFFAAPKTWVAPDGFRFSPSMTARTYGYGYCPGRPGLQTLLTNAAYIGHFVVNDMVAVYDNHPAIVDRDSFYAAFNYLSELQLDGQANLQFRGVSYASRPVLEEGRESERPLCAGLVGSYLDGKWYKAGTRWVGTYKHYGYSVNKLSPKDGELLWHRKAEYIDQEVARLTRSKLSETFSQEKWNNHLSEAAHAVDKERIVKERQREALEETMKNLIASLDQLTIPAMIRRVEERYSASEAEHQRLTAELSGMQSDVARLTTLQKLKDTIVPVLERWDELPTEQKRGILHTLIDRVVVTPLEAQALTLTINWLDGTTDTVDVARKGVTYKGWLVTEVDRLETMYRQGATKEAISATFPQRTWSSIYSKLVTLTDTPPIFAHPCDIKGDETYIEYCKRTDTTLPRKARNGLRWSRSEDEKLVSLMASEATQLELAETFRNRTWKAIYTRVKQLCGDSMTIPGQGGKGKAGSLKRYETYETYILRQKGAEEAGQKSLTQLTTETHPGITLLDAPTRFRPAWARCHRRPAPLVRWYDAGRGRGAFAGAAARCSAYPPHCKCVRLP